MNVRITSDGVKAKVETTDGKEIEGVYAVDIELRVDALPRAVLYVYPALVDVTTFADEVRKFAEVKP